MPAGGRSGLLRQVNFSAYNLSLMQADLKISSSVQRYRDLRADKERITSEIKRARDRVRALLEAVPV